MTYGQAYLKGWKQAFNFVGRSDRREFWSFFLINALIVATPLLIWYLATLYDYRYGVLSLFLFPLAFVLHLPMIIPILAVGFRRMHDIGRSGFWFLPGIVFPVFFILSLAMCCLRSAPEPSR
ncbi:MULTISPECIES: DUF805 domain-containing protein [Klebsiella]|jgi:Predicted membrane protein|uniref:DUF805 domain-containing protein n=1 Tax=Klebsiella TaxID=570 RepID=UPI00063C734C|nr:DUF805 domain-containing protein [Klebsiella aerogenes]EIW9479778.1 DUF805 domain-containing protein [Klebsiella aerogenes]EIW9499982.1 DUF805 domain-containing protein [Klebsiella aerogenes]EKM7515327.1 DUF805 domain-containing protein [Klebsiella aerogenes]EKU6610677.1 DUF805 domain-containing protein [Klebsiella aerogenes]EKW5858529.1 DUF805 domain-containing protein [Klebsiella aerogenes]